MNEAKIAEITKRSILSNANNRCEVCSIPLGYGKDEEKPHFYYIIPLFQGGEDIETNITVLCEKDGERFHELDKETLKERAMYRENAEPFT
ncbi:MAG: hypothetical protein ACE5HH_01225 [Candidatus Hydrothermarchaeales archaeon]